ncbi:MAG: 30S ribosomal protein S16 [Mycobacteriales bacterium]
MAAKIKLMRLGKMRAPYYRIVIADARTKRDGRSIETIGKYHPKQDPSFMEVNAERAAYWLSVGAQPTEAVTAILKVTGDWQRFKGLPAPPPMRVAPARVDKRTIFEAAARAAAGLEDKAATTAKGGRKPKSEPAAPEPAAELPAETSAEPAAPEPAAELPAETSAEPADTDQ